VPQPFSRCRRRTTTALGLMLVMGMASGSVDGRAESGGLDAGDERSEPAAGAPTRQRVRAFFSGHSLLDNPLPNWIEAMAQSRGDSLGWQQQIVLGSPIRIRTRGEEPSARDHSGYRLGRSRAGGPIDVLRELEQPVQLAPGEKYDRLVITERPDLLGAMQWEGTLEYLRDYHERVVQQNSEASTLLYQVWPEIDRKDPTAWIRYVEKELLVWECLAARVNEPLEAAGRRDRVRVVPAGLALGALVQRALDGDLPGVEGTVAQKIDAIFVDDLHLTPIGIYLMAAMHYGALFDRSPVGAGGAAPIPPALLPLLQGVAQDTLSAYRARASRAPTFAECSTRIAQEVCPAYHRIRGHAARAERCELWTQPDNPLAGGPPPDLSSSRQRWSWGIVLAVLAALGWGWARYRRAYPGRPARG
jgi:hypothetical protein